MVTATADGVLRELQAAGIHLALLPDGRLRATPAERLTDEHRGKIRQHKGGLAALLGNGNASAAAGGPEADKVPMHHPEAERGTTGIVSRRDSESEAGAGPHPADAMGLQDIRRDVAGRAVFMAHELADDIPSPAVEVGADVPEEVGRLIAAGAAWRPQNWASELRRRAGLVGNPATAARMLQAADTIEAGLWK